MVEKVYVCKEKDDEITVMNFLTNSEEFVPIKHLLSDQDGNVTFPSSLYKIVNKDIILSDVTEEMVLELLDWLSPCIYTDKEFSCLPDFEIDLAPFIMKWTILPIIQEMLKRFMGVLKSLTIVFIYSNSLAENVSSIMLPELFLLKFKAIYFG